MLLSYPLAAHLRSLRPLLTASMLTFSLPTHSFPSGVARLGMGGVLVGCRGSYISLITFSSIQIPRETPASGHTISLTLPSAQTQIKNDTCATRCLHLHCRVFRTPRDGTLEAGGIRARQINMCICINAAFSQSHLPALP